MKKKYFGTDGIRGKVGETPISVDWVLKLGWSLGKVLAEHCDVTKIHPDYNCPGKVLIGKDTRISGYMFESALEAGLAAAGVDICLLGPMPTPAIAYLTRTLQASAGIIISASHNPHFDNGIKFVCKDGFKLSDECELEIEEYLTKDITTVPSKELGKATRLNDAAGRYIEFCKSTLPFQTSLNGMKIVLDCANGATYYVAPNIFQELGAQVITFGVEPDGININKNCGSTNPTLLSEEVRKHKADIGIAFDGDGDRVIMVDNTGAVIDGDEIIFIIAKWYKETNRLKGGVAGTLMSNLGMEIALKDMGIPFTRTKVGDKYVLKELKKKGWNIGGESSGHIICLDINTTGDGIVSALQVIGAMKETGKSLYELKQGMQKFPQLLINVPLGDERPKIVMENPKLLAAIKLAEKKLKNSGRVLLRSSGTEPLIRVMVEGKDATQIKEVANQLVEDVKSTLRQKS